MKLINELVTPFNNKQEIDIEMFNKLIDISLQNKNDYQLLFSNIGDGLLLSLEEKIALIKSIKKENISKVIYYLQLINDDLDNKTISFLEKSDIEYIFITPPYGYLYGQNGLFLYIKNIIKRLKNKKIILHNTPLTTSVNFHFQTLKKLIKISPNLIGLYENGIDYSLIRLLKINFPTFKIFVNESLIEYSLDNSLDGLVSSNSLLFGLDYISIFEDYKTKFKDVLLINYLIYVHEILSFCNNSTLIKAYLRKIGYSSMEVRLPLVIDLEDEENLDFLLS